MAYIITNSSGNRFGVHKHKYYELIEKEGYTGEIIEDKKSSDYTVSELKEMKDDVKDWESFIKDDDRKSVHKL